MGRVGRWAGWAATGVSVAVLVAACSSKAPMVENFNPLVPVSRFKIIGTVASSTARMDVRMMIQVRDTLKTLGINAIRTGGNFDNVADALKQLCGPNATQPLDGVLLVAYDDLTLYDCLTTKPAYEIYSQTLGLPTLVNRLVQYLTRKEGAAQ